VPTQDHVGPLLQELQTGAPLGPNRKGYARSLCPVRQLQSPHYLTFNRVAIQVFVEAGGTVPCHKAGIPQVGRPPVEAFPTNEVLDAALGAGTYTFTSPFSFNSAAENGLFFFWFR
jgi:hypothetical protein